MAQFRFRVSSRLPAPLDVAETAKLYGVGVRETRRVVAQADAAFADVRDKTGRGAKKATTRRVMYRKVTRRK